MYLVAPPLLYPAPYRPRWRAGRAGPLPCQPGRAATAPAVSGCLRCHVGRAGLLLHRPSPRRAAVRAGRAGSPLPHRPLLRRPPRRCRAAGCCASRRRASATPSIAAVCIWIDRTRQSKSLTYHIVNHFLGQLSKLGTYEAIFESAVTLSFFESIVTL